MSILIKGMEMPKHSGKNNIPDLHKACIKVYANGKCDLVLMEGKEHYPLVEVPTPHGDLIDRDELASKLIPVKDAQSRIGQTFMEWLIALIKEKPPTIIDSEGES